MPSIRYKPSLFLPAVLFVTALFGSCDLFGSGGSGYSSFQQYTLAEINLLRTSPVEYAESRLKDNYDDGNDNGAYNDIRGNAPVEALSFNAALCRTAEKYARYLAVNNLFGHYEDGTPSQRAEREGYTGGCGENIAAAGYSVANAETSSREAARYFVEMLVIDEGVDNLGHRKNLVNGQWHSLGIGYYRDLSSTYKNYTVQNFGEQ